jgi:surfactin synthase thioesterase subunit
MFSENIIHSQDCYLSGNPGLVDFYIPFLTAIHARQLSSNLAIIAKAHVDHYPGKTEGVTRYRPEESLTVQVQASLELLETMINFYEKKPRIIVIGHSVGAWISLQVLCVVFRLTESVA